jgi:hypothetical protein
MTRRGSRPGRARRPPTTRNPAAQRKGVSNGWHQYQPDGRPDGSGHRRHGRIGKATAAGLAAMGARVGITGRDPARTWAAAADVATASGNPAVDPFAISAYSAGTFLP